MRRMIDVDVLRETVSALVVAALVAGCGSQSSPPADREWVANARGVVDQLRADVVAVAEFDRLGPAGRALHDESQLYGLLVAYVDFGGCRHMVAALGVEPPRAAGVVRLLGRACRRLQRADVLFTRAVGRSAPRLLVSATREAVAAVPILDAAALRLAHRAAS